MDSSNSLDQSALTERVGYVGELVSLMDGAGELASRALAGSAALWIAAVDETLVKANPVVGPEKYKVRRAQEQGGQTVRALKLARNEIAHGSALITKHGATFPIEFPVAFNLRYISAEELSARRESRQGEAPNAHDLGLYRQLVAGEEPKSVLRHAFDWLRAVAPV